MKKRLVSAALSGVMMLSATANAADYVIDTQGAHAFVTFKIKHLGYRQLMDDWLDQELLVLCKLGIVT